MAGRVGHSPSSPVVTGPAATAARSDGDCALDPALRALARAHKPSAFDRRGALDAKAALTQEQAAISQYLAATWNITGALPVRELLQAGFAAGLALAEHDFSLNLRGYNGEAEAVNRRLGTARFPVFAVHERAPVLDFEARIKGLFREHSLTQSVKAAVKKKAPAATFSGQRQHLRMGSTSFATYVSPGDVEYHRERGRSPLNTVVSAIVRQGMSVGLDTFAKTYEAALEAERARMAKAVGAPSGTSALEHLIKTGPALDPAKLSPAIRAQLRALFDKIA